MGLLNKLKNIISKKGESNQAVVKLYEEGLSKTRETFVSKLNILGIKYTKVNIVTDYITKSTKIISIQQNK